MARVVKAPPSVQWARFGLLLIAVVWMLVVVPLSAHAAPYAALVMDARTGKVLHQDNANARLHPASLTKMMTLYIAFEAIENGEISADDYVTISAKAAAEPPSKLGLRKGQKIKLRYLIRAAAVKSANDAATAIGEAIAGSEAAFARRMNRTAKAMGMSKTTFKNAHGLTENGHLSTARDMTVLGRHVFYDYPDYYNLFKRITADAGVKTVSHTNRRFLNGYPGADGIKTGYTRAAGFNLTASARKGNERIIVTVFGGASTTSRNAKVASLMDLGFRKAPTRVAVNKPAKPRYTNTNFPAGKTIRVSTVLKTSIRPVARPVAAAPVAVAGLTDDIAEAVALAALVDLSAGEGDTADPTAPPAVTPQARPKALSQPVANQAKPAQKPEVVRVVARATGSNERIWGINVGRFGSTPQAERMLVTTALQEIETLDGAQRKVLKRKSGYDANFLGMTREKADLACRRLQARNVTCFMVGPS